MALSKPQLGIQSPIQCQLCERDPKITWKCLECDLLMCSACKNNIHPKIKTSGEHRILSIKDIGSSSSNVDMTVVETYQTKLEDVNKIAISSDGLLWISDGNHKKRIRLFGSHTGLQQVKCEGDRLKVISSFNIIIHDIAVTPDNDLLVVTDSSKLKQIKSGTNKVVDTVYNVEPYEPVSIHVSRNNMMIVGALFQKGIVIVMDHDGNREKVYGESPTKDISIIYPSDLTATSNANIFVIDSMYGMKDEKRVIVLGHEAIINTYFGHSVINTEDKPFTPYELISTPTDNVIVADRYTFTLHILNSSGYLMTYVKTEDKGIAHPSSIGLGMTGHSCMLYIGTSEDKGKDARIYKLSLTGC